MDEINGVITAERSFTGTVVSIPFFGLTEHEVRLVISSLRKKYPKPFEIFVRETSLEEARSYDSPE